MANPGVTLSDGAFTVPAALRHARFVPRQAADTRRPLRVPASAFLAAGLAVPEKHAQRNAYQLSRRQGLPWSPEIDRHISRRGGECMGHGALVLVDIDTPAAADGSPAADSLGWLSDRAAEAGEILELTGNLAVRTPGHAESGHLPGWHFWYAADPSRPVRLGSLGRFPHIELKARGTCPGTPGYEVASAPAELPRLPRWIAALAGPPPQPRELTAAGKAAKPEARLRGVIAKLLEAGEGERNNVLFWASVRAGEIVAEGGLDEATAYEVLRDAAAEIGLLSDDGEHAVAGTITSGLRRAVSA